ncbi:type 3 dihydrofolate reductase [Paraglaciecola aestuariivivens]
MQISMIAAMANNRVIGAKNAMPWHLPADLKHFKATTLGKPVVMGRKTYKSIGKALPKRLNIVITTDPAYTLPDATVVNSCEEALKVAQQYCQQHELACPEVMIIGGGSIYQYFLSLCHKLYLTYIDLEVAGDTYFPDYEKAYRWTTTQSESHLANDANPYNYQFVTLEKQKA